MTANHQNGGKGKDKHWGGSGEDCFLFDFKMTKKSAKKHWDKIYDFNAQEDAILSETEQILGPDRRRPTRQRHAHHLQEGRAFLQQTSSS